MSDWSEREPRLSLRAAGGRATTREPSPVARPSRPDRELRLRRRIDALLHARHRKELRILELERRLRLDESQEARILELQRRVAHWNRRFLDVSAELREARRVA